jgi:hypothetical protein
VLVGHVTGTVYGVAGPTSLEDVTTSASTGPVAILHPSAGAGYVLVGQDGGAFVLGSGAHFAGSLLGKEVTVDYVVGIALTADDNGYYMASANGAVYSFGDAPSLHAPPGVLTDLPIVPIAGT